MQHGGNAQWLEKLKIWCGGYYVGNTPLFNPWPILKLLHTSKAPENKQLKKISMLSIDKTFYEGSSILVNNLIEQTILKLIQTSDNHIIKLFETLANNQPITVEINRQITIDEIKDKPYLLFSFLLLGGYLTHAKPIPDNKNQNSDADKYLLIIPNYQVYEYFVTYFKMIFPKTKTFKFERRHSLVDPIATNLLGNENVLDRQTPGHESLPKNTETKQPTDEHDLMTGESHLNFKPQPRL